MLERVVTEFGDLDLFVGSPKLGKLGKQAKMDLFESRNLVVSCRAPEIVAEDSQGVRFKLSDYRGKVVLLDFWGHW